MRFRKPLSVLCTMNLKYLIHQGKLGKGNLHPGGTGATHCLIKALKLEKGHRLLEIGCGTCGTMVMILSSYNVSVDGVDVLPEMLKIASLRLRLSGLSSRARLFGYLISDKLPFANDYYDRVYAESVLGFQEREVVEISLSEIYRVLKKGGLFITNEAIWKKNTALEDIERINASCIRDFGLRQASEEPRHIDEWKSIISKKGFEIVSSELLNELLSSRKGTKKVRTGYGAAISRLITIVYTIKGRLLPKLRNENSRYKELLAKHSSDGKYIESRLFVLRKS